MHLREARLAKALSLDALAARAGVTSGQVWKIKRGAVTPTLRSRRLLAEALGVEPTEIEWPGLALGAITSRSQILTKSMGGRADDSARAHRQSEGLPLTDPD